MVKLVFLFKRKPGTTAEQFRAHYESSHAPLALRLLPYFKDYTRKFIRHDQNHQTGGLAGEVEFDVITELTFESKDDYDRMLNKLADPAIINEIIADEERFMDRSPGGRLMFFVDEEKTPPAKLKEFA